MRRSTCGTCAAWSGKWTMDGYIDEHCRRNPPDGAGFWPRTLISDWCLSHVEIAPDISEMYPDRPMARKPVKDEFGDV
jgi:hypothetical protein